MPFDHRKTAAAHSGDSFWTSYSDLFLGLSTIFLLLYVTASLRTGTDALKSQIDNQKLALQVDELKSQLKMYEQIKSDYMKNTASKDETQEYVELMDKLSLLEEDSKNDQQRLARESLENDTKAKALNKYQQLIRNVINANKVAKTKIITRNGIIDEKDVVIDQQSEDISSLETDVSQKRQLIAQNENQIQSTKTALEKSKLKLQAAFRKNEMTKKQFEAKKKMLQDQSEEKIRHLVANNKATSVQLAQLSEQLNESNANLEEKDQALVAKEAALAHTSKALAQKNSALAQTNAVLAQKNSVLEQTSAELAAKDSALAESNATVAQKNAALAQKNAALAQKKAEADQLRGESAGLKGQMASLRSGYEAQKASDRAKFDAELRKGKIGAAEAARREGEFRAAAAHKEAEMNGRLAGLQGRLGQTEGALAKAKEEIDARREIAKEIKTAFAKAGVQADVDMQTGEVVLDFGGSYFDSDSANLKPKMKDVIEKAMPAYSLSLFGNKKIADKISAVEVIGYASPTYQGRYVDPHSSKPEDKTALKYNMNLSYRRANSIFDYIVEHKGEEFAHQHELLGLMKVSGRSFLEVMKVQGRSPAKAGEFCKVNDCKKTQKVIVRFSMDGNKQGAQ